MPRPRRCRRVWNEPNVNYFKPAGIRLVDLEEIVLEVDEFESIRLKDLEGLEQEECAKKMSISQPTFHRLVTSARKKISDAIVNGKAIRIEGGSFRIVRPRSVAATEDEVKDEVCCSCPSCGYSESRADGVPCFRKKCPKCGNKMLRRD